MRTAWMQSPALSASSSRFNRTTPAPSARTNPRADASNAFERPSGDNIDAAEKLTNESAVIITLTPPIRARSHSPVRTLLAARSSATSDEEHAVSTMKLGPRRSKQYEIRLAAMLNDVPCAENAPRLRRCDESDWIRA